MPISVIRSPSRSPPVVSMSSTQNVTSASGVPRSSKERCPPAAEAPSQFITNGRSVSRTGVRSWRRGGLGTVDRVSGESPEDVPDQALQSALELAVGIAAAGVKLRPPLAFPPALKKFLKFHKLPPAALTEVRAAVEADDGFRQQLALVATSELVDEVGMLWLARPDGWSEAIGELLPTKVDDDETQLRRERRRRLAAEDSAARGTRRSLVDHRRFGT